LTQFRSVFGDTPKYFAASEIRMKSDSFSTSTPPTGGTPVQQRNRLSQPYQASLYLPMSRTTNLGDKVVALDKKNLSA
jgi:hypothetical protein